MIRVALCLAGMILVCVVGVGPLGTAVAGEPAQNDELVAARDALTALKAEMRAWRNNSFELQKNLVSEDKRLAELQKEIAAKEEETLRLRQEFNKRLDEHPEIASRREKQRNLAEKYKKAQEAYNLLNRQSGGAE